jgi:hypothetical protein
MLARAIRLSAIVAMCQASLAAPVSAAMIGWEYYGTVSTNGSHYAGINPGDPVVMTMMVDTAAANGYSSAAGPGLAACGLYSIPMVRVTFGGMTYESSPAMTINTAAAAGNCGYGPSQDGYVLGGGASGPSPGPLPWRFYAEIRDVPVSDALPVAPPLGSGVFLDLAYGFFPPSGALFSITANLDSVRATSESAAIPEPATLALALVTLSAFGARRASRRRR